jgi:tetratricopeptide (TPR) repeat protein
MAGVVVAASDARRPPRPAGVTDTRLYLNHLPEYDWLIALEFGRVDDGQPKAQWRGVTDHVGFLLDAPDGREVGFKITELAVFDDETRDVDEVWDGPRFHVPQLGLGAATVGEIVLASRALFGDEPTINRVYFSAGVAADGEAALADWLDCLEAGDCMAHFALGYTLYDLGRHREAYRHLRYYAELAPAGAWNWCWYGKAAEAIGEFGEAQTAYRRAIALEPDDDPTDAADLLHDLLIRLEEAA